MPPLHAAHPPPPFISLYPVYTGSNESNSATHPETKPMSSILASTTIARPARLPLANDIWNGKYRFKLDGQTVDADINATWRRVSAALAEAEQEDRRAFWADEFLGALSGFQFLPGGRILAGAGTGRAVTLFNCFVMGAIEDDLGSIFTHLREAALTMQAGGGIGYDFSTLRPRGALVKGVGAEASGPLSFMDIWNTMCNANKSLANRSGAMMATMRCDHPDIEAFIDAKREPGRLRNFNLSVLVTDAFMAAVDADQEWPLVFGGKTYRTVQAKDLWNKIMRSAYEYAEPGVIFIDRVNQMSALSYTGEIAASNPCGEKPMPPYASCLLGSINLAALVKDAFTTAAHIDAAHLDQLVATAVRMLDNVIDVSNFPLPQQEARAKAERRIGLGITGLADALAMCGIRYGSEAAQNLTRQWLAAIERSAILASINLATEKGSFPAFDADQYLATGYAMKLDADLRSLIKEHGLRNGELTSIAPTGTISLFADNISSGIEPVFAYSYTRNVTQKDGSRKPEEVSDYAYRLFREMFGTDAPLPDYFVTINDLTPAEHVAMVAAAQQHIDSSISKTVNCPEDITFEAFQDVYRDAYRSGCKGCTTYRPNATTGSILTVKKDEAPAAATPAAIQPAAPAKPSRPESLPGETLKFHWAPMDANVFVTINHMTDPATGCRRPWEVFINTAGSNIDPLLKTLSLTISAAYQSMTKEARDGLFANLAKVAEDEGMIYRGQYRRSIQALIFFLLSEHEAALAAECATLTQTVITAAAATATPAPTAQAQQPQPAQQPPAKAKAHGHKCKCGSTNVKFEAGCMQCLDCGHSRCG